MNNIYEIHLNRLTCFVNLSEPCVSIFVPLIWSEFTPQKAYKALIKVANKQLVSNGHDPIEAIPVEWGKWMREGATTLAIYRCKDFTSFVSLPLRMSPKTFVASSFHIKPLLASSVCYAEALLIHFNEMGASVYRVNSGTEELIDTFLPPKIKLRGDWMSKLSRSEIREFLVFLKSEVIKMKSPGTQFLGLTGTGDNMVFSNDFWKDTGLAIAEMTDLQNARFPVSSITSLRLKISSQSNEKYRKRVESLLSDSHSSKNDLSILGQLILDKKLTKLCVSLEDLHFGSLDLETGISKIEDFADMQMGDDVMDDLVELALKNGIQVSVVPKIFMPNGKSFLAS